MATATKTPKAQKLPKAQKPVEATPTAPAVTDEAVQTQPQNTEAPAVKRGKKNATATAIDPTKPETIEQFLKEFYEQSAAQPPTQGYDQHWNAEGFIHAGPSKRLPNRGAANMVVFLFDVLAQRQAAGDENAGAFYEALLSFAAGWRAGLQRKADEKLIADAEAAKARLAAK